MTGIKVCPNCGSTDVERESSGVAAMMGLDFGYRCNTCDYTSKLFIEVEPDKLEDLQQELEEANPDTYLDPDTPVAETQTGPPTWIGIVFLLLGLGAIPAARLSFEGVFGVLLIPIGLYIIWRNHSTDKKKRKE